ncbi:MULTISPECIES: GNAT family N-acetyltransferase [Streptomyces]|uniref:Lysine N-acyltransferase MbtK n=1 Tax=Streptomyces xinghaiensis TaxID=1038928 RepID=A0A3R7EN89_9ACTN|nr:GNAT family N-acetyltransferase [Streptomyces xinghaiensis]PQM19453.1 N-acetyltransferase [Streptomyces xinghaiensis]RKM92780.1 N-acetyltransferase [Streptomyces xinghaiensis]RNC69123.1 N-acetyltransferase [Streptomyces xinghaiensis]
MTPDDFRDTGEPARTDAPRTGASAATPAESGAGAAVESGTESGTGTGGPPRTPVHERHVDGFGTVRVVSVDPARDTDLLHDWVTRDRARFWGMREHSREQVREIYEFLDSLPTHHAYLIHRDGRPVALFQTYEPSADPVGDCYDVQPGDFGLHLMIGPADGAPEPGFTDTLLSVFLDHLLAEDPHRGRIVAEPDARNAKAIGRLRRTGFEPGPEIELPGKRAQMLFLERDTHLARARASRSGPRPTSR